MTTSAPEGASSRGRIPRLVCRLAVVVAVVLAVGTLFVQVSETLTFFGEQPDVSEGQYASWYWTYLWTGIALAIVAVLCIFARTWVSLAVAILLGIGCVFCVVSLYPQVRETVNPAPVYTLDPDYCACHSGGSCDCPGG